MLANDEINLSAKELRELNNSRVSLMKNFCAILLHQRRNRRGRRKNRSTAKRCMCSTPTTQKPNYKFDTCRSPIPGDDVLGFVDEDENVVLHKVRKSPPRCRKIGHQYPRPQHSGTP